MSLQGSGMWRHLSAVVIGRQPVVPPVSAARHSRVLLAEKA